MGKLVGIDLGTTFSAISYLDDSGRPTVIDNQDGDNITPSIVMFNSKDNVDVGMVAYKNYGVDPNIFGRFKREMGTNKEYEAFGEKYSPTTLSSFVLKKLIDDAAKDIGEISEGVVTIPANFSNDAREATMAAAKMAGLTVKHIINEPTAAALYYAFASGEELHGNYAIYDLGGGTFDVSIIKVEGTDIEVINSDGVSKLGGDDFDEKIIELVRSKFKDKTGKDLEPEDFTKNDAEDYKKSLSTKESVKIRITSPVREVIELTRVEFEEAISTYIAQTEMICESVIEESKISTDQIKEIVLVGGSTRMPMVSKSIERVFKKAPITFKNPDEAVSLGAALYVAYKADTAKLTPLQQKAVSQVNISDVTTKNFGTIVLDSASSTNALKNVILIKKGAKIPCSVSEDFYTISDNQTAVDCTITECANDETDPDFVQTKWKGVLDLPSGRLAGQKIVITYSYDENQIMKCSFVDEASKNKTEIDLSVNNEALETEIDINKFKVE